MSQPQLEFINLITQVMERLGISIFDTQATAYRFGFADEPAIFLYYRGEGWAELVTCADKFSDNLHRTAPLALLELQGQQPSLAFCLALDKERGMLKAFHRFRFAHCNAFEVIDSIQAMRAFASQARAIIGQRSPASTVSGESNSNQRFKLSTSIMKLQNR
ncbi:MAG TPA: hypothetical protein VLG17_18000 [Pseudomonas sp.]|uniref:hypothetical protein n=1 Tax=Pseudomonas sp. TaxID=306 RepID=UPI0026110551|nr:hypothetical protein [Pseudomonas sp.]HSX89872.1 hypothetical protein [Pseudomonas sp.]